MRKGDWEVRKAKWGIFEVNGKGKLSRPKDRTDWGGEWVFSDYDSEQEAWNAVEDKADEIPNRDIIVLPVRYIGVRIA